MLIAGTPEFLAFTLVMMRMSGFVFLNPVFGRNNIPTYFKTGLVLLLTIIVYYQVGTVDLEVTTAVMYAVLLLKEFAIGYLLGFVMQLFDMVFTFAGAIMDYQMGLSMATVYDTQNGTQVAVTGNVLQIFYLLLFFAVDGHLALLKIIMTSQNVVPYATVHLGNDAAQAMLQIFLQCVVLAVKLAFPLIAFEFMVQIATGILMKIIPQINLFVISIQMRVLIGLVMLIFLISPIGDYIGNVITQMVQELQNILRTIAV